MPYLRIETNADAGESEKQAMLKELSELLAAELGKPEKYVMVHWHHCPDLIFSGSCERAAFMDLKSIGLTPGQAQSLSGKLTHYMTGHAGLKADRMYIRFENALAEYWGWDGKTFG